MTVSAPLPHIQWHEGMLLSPQHFQQESARLDGLLAWQSLSANALAWGVKQFDIDESLLVNGLLRVNSLEAIFPDGTPYVYNAEDQAGESLEIALTDWEDALSEGELNVYLALGINRSLNAPGQISRFHGIDAPAVADEISEALPIDLPRMKIKVQLMAGERPSSIYKSMRLLCVRKENEVYGLGPTLPPLLSLSPVHPIWQSVVHIVAQLRVKAMFLAKLTSSPSSRLEERLDALEQKSKLSALVQALAGLQAVLSAPEVPPFLLYTTLCNQLGVLSTLRPGAVPIQVPRWQHDDPLSAFEPVLAEIEDLMAEVSQDWRPVVFGFDGNVFSLPGDRLPKSAHFYIGLRGRTDAELTQWMNGAVIGSQTVWTLLSDRRVLGVSRKKVDQVEELGLRASSGYTIFSVELRDSFIVMDQPLLISNVNEANLIPRPREIVLFEKASK
jgi:type VI secretion system protein ImpJ